MCPQVCKQWAIFHFPFATWSCNPVWRLCFFFARCCRRSICNCSILLRFINCGTQLQRCFVHGLRSIDGDAYVDMPCMCMAEKEKSLKMSWVRTHWLRSHTQTHTPSGALEPIERSEIIVIKLRKMRAMQTAEHTHTPSLSLSLYPFEAMSIQHSELKTQREWIRDCRKRANANFFLTRFQSSISCTQAGAQHTASFIHILFICFQSRKWIIKWCKMNSCILSFGFNVSAERQ